MSNPERYAPGMTNKKSNVFGDSLVLIGVVLATYLGFKGFVWYLLPIPVIAIAIGAFLKWRLKIGMLNPLQHPGHFLKVVLVLLIFAAIIATPTYLVGAFFGRSS